MLTKKQIKQLIEMYMEDIKAKHIAKKLGVSRVTIYNYLKKSGIKPNRKSK
jgi:predicted DNA-binding protein YlxM (UPF0122 family)